MKYKIVILYSQISQKAINQNKEFAKVDINVLY